MSLLRIGIIGAGVISQQYLETFARTPDVDVVALGDLRPEAAQARAVEFGVPRAGGVETVLDDPDVDLVVNLTIPAAHALVATQAVQAGKHVWNEKPLTGDLASAKELLATADAAGVRVGCAPDTVLGPAWQTVRQVIERGDIGRPVSGLALFQSPGPESWHPSPEFLFQRGGGPLLDIGPYYLTALAQIFGSATEVQAVGGRSRDTRTIGSGPRAGTVFDVTVPTTVSTVLRYAEGGVAQALFSFDSALRRIQVEISGTEGTLIAPDPNQFGGVICVLKPGADEPVPVAEVSCDVARGIGVVDMARSIATGEPHRASGELAAHILDVMLTAEAQAEGRPAALSTSAPKPRPVPPGWDPTRPTS